MVSSAAPSEIVLSLLKYQEPVSCLPAGLQGVVGVQGRRRYDTYRKGVVTSCIRGVLDRAILETSRPLRGLYCIYYCMPPKPSIEIPGMAG